MSDARDASAPQPTPSLRPDREPIRWVVIVPVMVAAVAIVLVIVLFRPGPPPKQVEPWPHRFGGTWQFVRTAVGLPPVNRPQRIFSRSVGGATICFASDPSSTISYAFRRDALTVTYSDASPPVTYSDASPPMVYRRVRCDGVDFVGRYVSTHEPQTAPYDYRYGLDYDGVVLKLTFFSHDTDAEWLTFRLSKDGKTMFEQTGGSGVPAIDVYTKVEDAASR